MKILSVRLSFLLIVLLLLSSCLGDKGPGLLQQYARTSQMAMSASDSLMFMHSAKADMYACLNSNASEMGARADEALKQAERSLARAEAIALSPRDAEILKGGRKKMTELANLSQQLVSLHEQRLSQYEQVVLPHMEDLWGELGGQARKLTSADAGPEAYGLFYDCQELLGALERQVVRHVREARAGKPVEDPGT